MEVLNLALHNTMLQRQLWLKGSKLLGLIRPIGGTSLFSSMASRFACRSLEKILKSNFDERSLRGRQALFRSYKNSYPVLYKLLQENYEEIVSQEFRMPPLLVAHPKPLENDKPKPFFVKRRSESKPFCASCVVQSAAMSDWGNLSAAEWANLSAGELVNLSAEEWAMRVGVHEIGDKVRHWKSGRSGTVTAVYEFYINIKFDLFNPDGWKYDNDGWNETRRRDCFIATQKRPIATVSNVDESAAKRARLQ